MKQYKSQWPAFLKSLEFILVPMFLFIIGVTIFSHQLFLDVMPLRMNYTERDLASWTVSICWEVTVLITLCNSELIRNKHLPKVLAFISSVLMSLFIDAWDFTQSPKVICTRFLISALIGFLAYMFPELAHKRLLQRIKKIVLLKIVKKARAIAADLRIKLTQAHDEIRQAQSEIVKAHEEAKKAHAELASAQAELKKAHEQILSFTEQAHLKCMHCGEAQTSLNNKRVHQQRCTQNPKNNKLAA